MDENVVPLPITSIVNVGSLDGFWEKVDLIIKQASLASAQKRKEIYIVEARNIGKLKMQMSRMRVGRTHKVGHELHTQGVMHLRMMGWG